MIKLGEWQYVERMTWQSWESKLFAANPLDHILDDFEFIWFPSNKPKFFRHKTMRQLRYTRADRAARLNRNLRLREMEFKIEYRKSRKYKEILKALNKYKSEIVFDVDDLERKAKHLRWKRESE